MLQQNSFYSNQHIEQVMSEHGKYLIRLAYMYVKDWHAAEDIMQEVFIRYYRNLTQFENRSTLKTYLYKITVNCCYDYLRSWKNKKSNFTGTITNLASNKASPENETLTSMESSLLIQKILSLSLKYREVGKTWEKVE